MDRRGYRIPLEWQGQLKSRQISSFALSLAAEKSYVNLSVAYFCYGHFLNKQNHYSEATYYLNTACELAFSLKRATLVAEPIPLLAMYSLLGH